MQLTRLKKIRVVISILFFVLTAFLFLDFRNHYSGIFSDAVLFLQFFPSLLKFITVLSIAAIGFIIVLVLTMLFGRIYCSTICPLGTLQDIITFIKKKIKKKIRFRFSKAFNILRYSILLATVISIAAGSLILINLLDPFSNFGRIFTNLFKPILVGFNNLVSLTLKNFDNYSVYPFEIKGLTFEFLIVPILILALILWLASIRGRLFCNTVCPVGTLLGLLSKFSVFKFLINSNECTHCDLCDSVCKAECINSKDTYVDMSRCVGCFNCLEVCSNASITYKLAFNTKRKAIPDDPDPTKRRFVFSSLIALLGLTGLTPDTIQVFPRTKGMIPAFSKNPATPPGSISLDHFKNLCTACNLCISSCPTQVLQPAFFEYGLSGILQPTMDYHIGYCDYDCNICLEVCPTGAILPFDIEKKKRIQVGKSKFIKDSCIVYTDHTDCGACAEPCPTHAVEMVPFNVLFVPNVDEDICIGCGACEKACPTKPYKAIYVEANKEHLTAKEPIIKESEEEIDYQEDFPF